MANTHTSETESPLFLKLEAVANRYAEVNKQHIDPSGLNQPALIHKLNKERTEIQELTELFYEYRVVLRELDEADQILKDPGAEAELQKLAADEARRLQARRREIEGRALELLAPRSEEHTSELQSQSNLVCRLLLEKKKAATAADSGTYRRSSRAEER